LTLAADAGKLFGWPEMSFFLYVLGVHGDNPSESIGDAQGVSNIAAYRTWKLYEAWVQRNFPRFGLSVLAGFYDVNSEFDDLESADLFANASQGIDPTFAMSGPNGPSVFPTTTIGARVEWMPVPSIDLQTVVLNGVAGDPNDPRGTRLILNRHNGVLWTVEVDYLLRSSNPACSARHGPCPMSRRRSRVPDWRHHIGRFAEPEYDAKVGLGIWHYTSALEAVDRPDEGGGRIHGNPGLYLIGEMPVYRESADRAQGLTAFGRVGRADGRVNRFSFYAGGGFTYQGLLPGRDDDVIGAAVAAAFNGSNYRRAQERDGSPVERAETDLELFYRAVPARWLTIQPDLQYVIDPNTDPLRSNAVALGLRATIAL
jgi:porin